MKDSALAGAKRALSSALAAGSGDVEVSFAGRETHFVRFASSRFTQVGRTESLSMRIRVIAGDRLGTEVCATLRPQAIDAAARAAVELARMSPALDVPFSFAQKSAGDPRQPGGAAARGSGIPDRLTAVEAPGELRSAFDGHAGVKFAGALKTHRRFVGVVTAGELEKMAQHAYYDLGVIAEDDGATGYAGASGAVTREPDFADVCRRARDIAGRARDPIVVSPGAYDVVLAPEAIAELFEWMAMASFGGNKVLEETSLLCGAGDAAICDPRLTIIDQVGDEEPAFDAEGVDRRRVALFEAGMAGEPMTDRLTAARLTKADGRQRESTGHAPAVDSGSSDGPTISHLRMAPGQSTEADLIGSIERGIYVTRLHYVNGLLDTRRATTTGMTRDGAFLIQGGKLGRGIRNLRFTEHMLAALGRIGDIGDTTRDVPTWWSDAGVISVPAVSLREFHFTGQSR